MGKIVLPLLAAVLIAPLAAQNLGLAPTESQDTDATADVARPEETPTQPADAPVQPELQKIDAFIDHMKARLAIRGRDRGPFGLLEDPTTKVEAPVVIAPVIPVQKAPETPLRDIVAKIKVNGVRPADRIFDVGLRRFAEGETIDLEVHGRLINVRILSVGAREILFQNVETGEQAALPVRLMPEGLTRGQDGIHAPGMEADSPNAPLRIDDVSIPSN